MLYPPQSASRRAFAARALSLVGSLLWCCLFSFASPASAKTPMQEYVEAMQPGWNLGNTLDATPNETAWGNPLATQELIQHIKAQGFKSIRIPVTWDTGSRLGAAPNYTIDPAWLNRVQQVVDWSLDAGLYVMLNVHHDSYWVSKMPTDHDNVLAKFNAIWTQVATRFRDYPRELMLESINEPQFENVSDATSMALLNELNTSFFHIVRNMGGGNATRPLVLPSLNTNSGQQYLDSLKATMTALNDSNLIATVHYYGFWPFSVNITGVTTVNEAVVNDIMSSVGNTYNTFVADGIPVVVGELGLLDWGPDSLSIERGEALKFFELYTAAARARGITWQLWDAGQLLNRNTFQWRDPELVGYYLQSVTTRSSTAATDLIFVKTGAPADVAIPLNLNGNTFVSLTIGATTLTPGVDYTIAGDVLTVHASALVAYASGDYGEKAVFTANFSAGMPWKLHVRHNAVPALGAASGTKSGSLVIPTAFNGDLLATMEAKYVAAPHYPYPGQAEWTAFKQFNAAYEPVYANNTIVIKKEFFAATPGNEPIDLTFHFWSGRKVNYRLTFLPGGDIIADPQELIIYDNQFYGGWGNWSWTPTNENSEEVVHSPTKSIAVDANPWTGTMLGNWMLPLNRSDYRTLTVWANGGAVGGQRLTVSAVYNWAGTGSSVLTDPLPANTWTKLEIPLNSLGVTDSSLITGLVFSNNSGTTLPRYYLDDVRLTTAYPSTTVFVNGGAAPVITSATSAAGVFNSPFSYTVSAINVPTSFSATDLPAGLAIDAATGIISGTPAAAGSYLATVTATNAAGDGSQLVAIDIVPAPATVALSGLTLTYDGAAKSATITTTPADLPVTVTYNGDENAPISAGSYTVVATITDPNYAAAPASGTLVIEQAVATITLPSGSPFGAAFSATYDGTAQDVTITTSPAGLPITVTYNGSTTAPTLPGTYQVVVTSADANYSGSVQGTLVITSTALVRYAPTINGDLDGSLQLLSGESFTLNSSGSVASDLLVPGTPTVTLNGHPTFVGVVDAEGAIDPSNYRLTLNSGAVVRYVVRRVDPIALPVVTVNVTGTRDVALNNAKQNVGDLATVRSLTLNGNSHLTLGTAGATEATVYELQSLTINGNASVQIVGPVKLKLASGATVSGTLGSAEHPEWLQLEIAHGGLTVNGNATVNAIVTAPKGSVTINGTVNGRVTAERLTINGSGVLADPAQ